MQDKNVARCYAKALFDIAQEKNAIASYQADLELLATTLQNEADFALLITGRIITTSQKQQLIRDVFAPHISPDVLNMILIALEKGRESYFAGILEAFNQYIDEAAGIVPITVTGAIPLESQQLSTLSAAFADKLGKPVRMDTGINKDLIGGLTVQIGDTVYDGSIASQLASLQKQLSK